MPSRDINALTSTDTLVPSAARTAAGDSGAWYGFGPIETIRTELNVTAATGTSPNLTVFIEDSLDGTNWNVIGTFAAKTAAGREVLNITTPFAEMVRVRWAITGTTPSFQFSVVAFAQGANY